MKVPLGVLRAPAFDGSRVDRPRHSGRERGVAAASRCGAGLVRRRVGARRAALIELPHRPEHPPKQPAEYPATPDRAREEVHGGAGIVLLVLSEFGQHPTTLLTWTVLMRRRRKQMSCADRPESVRRVGD